MAIVELKNVAKRYESQHKGSSSNNAVDNFNLVTRDGEFVVLVGPSGCGKSTTMRMIAGLERNTGGEILIGGKDVSQVPPKERDIAMVFQSYALYPHMSVAENMGFSLRLKKRPAEEIKQKIDEAAQTLGIEHLLDRKPRELSGGQRQRVAVARALVNNPSILLADEPTGNLDSKTGLEILTLFERLHGTGNTIILITHEADVAAYAHRVIHLRDGRVEQDVRQSHRSPALGVSI